MFASRTPSRDLLQCHRNSIDSVERDPLSWCLGTKLPSMGPLSDQPQAVVGNLIERGLLLLSNAYRGGILCLDYRRRAVRQVQLSNRGDGWVKPAVIWLPERSC